MPLRVLRWLLEKCLCHLLTRDHLLARLFNLFEHSIVRRCAVHINRLLLKGRFVLGYACISFA